MPPAPSWTIAPLPSHLHVKQRPRLVCRRDICDRVICSPADRARCSPADQARCLPVDRARCSAPLSLADVICVLCLCPCKRLFLPTPSHSLGPCTDLLFTSYCNNIEGPLRECCCLLVKKNLLLDRDMAPSPHLRVNSVDQRTTPQEGRVILIHAKEIGRTIIPFLR